MIDEIREILSRELTGRTKTIGGVKYFGRVTEEFVSGGIGGRSLEKTWDWIPAKSRPRRIDMPKKPKPKPTRRPKPGGY